MEINFTDTDGVGIAELVSEEVEIRDAQDALDVMMNCAYQGADNMIVHQKNLTPEFFDLSSGIAGEILQKFSTYRARLAIVGDFEDVSSKSLRDFIYESNKMGRISFVSSVQDARKIFSKKK